MNQQQVPYKQSNVGSSVLRTFSQNIEEDELVWHRDEKDRLVEPLGETDWQFQFDNQLPIPINSPIFIPKETYHRLLKGTGTITVKITEY